MDKRVADDDADAARGGGVPPQSALQAILPHILRTFAREPALALTACYLFIALAGLAYDHGFYQRGFGIPVLTLAQVGDFLVAGLQQPMALVLLVSTLPLCWLFDWINSRARRRRQRKVAILQALPRRSWWQARRLRYLRWRTEAMWPIQLVYALVIIGYGWVFVSVYAGQRAADVKRGQVPRVAVRLLGAPADLAAADPRGWGYLGAVSSYVFLYDPKAGHALVVPVNAIARLQPEAVKARTGLPVMVVHLH